MRGFFLAGSFLFVINREGHSLTCLILDSFSCHGFWQAVTDCDGRHGKQLSRHGKVNKQGGSLTHLPDSCVIR